MQKECEKLFSDKLKETVSNYLKKRVFSACSLGYFKIQEDVVCFDTHHYGYRDIDDKAVLVNDKTVYDLASLTKPLVTALSIMVLIDKRVITLDDEIGAYFDCMRGGIGQIKISQLLTHSSGLPAHRPYYEVLRGYPEEMRKEKIVQMIVQENLLYKAGSKTLYSDLGYILLGFMVENVTGLDLNVFWEKEIVSPLNLQNEFFFPKLEGLGSDMCVATGNCIWSKRKLCGLVHDDNCRALGGIAGHAGLFGTAYGVLSLIKNILLQERGLIVHPAYNNDILRKFLKKRIGTRTYGFDTPSLLNSSSGKYFSKKTIGHLGFTGTSFWLDILQGNAIVLLTNRVIMDNSIQKIKLFRPIIHDITMEYLKAK